MDESTPCLNNAMGVKGVGELGTIGATPAVVNAVIDALARAGHGDKARVMQMPLTAEAIWRAGKEAEDRGMNNSLGAPWRKHVEQGESLYRVDRCRLDAAGHRRGEGAGQAPRDSAFNFYIAYTSVLKRAIARCGWRRRARPDVDSGSSNWRLNERMTVRCKGQQGRDRSQVRRRAGADLEAQLRHPAATAAGQR